VADHLPVRRPLPGLLALLTAGLALAPALPAAAAAPLPVPQAAVSLPADLEDLAPYVAQDSCDPVAKPGTLALARLLTATYAGSTIASLARPCGTDSAVSEHYDGRAVDWGVVAAVPAQAAQAQALLDWLLAADEQGRPAANARRLGIMYVIWDARIWGTWDQTWKPYACSGVTACHRDHVHLSLSWAGARGVTSWWTGTVAPTDFGPCRVPGLSIAPTPASPAANPIRCPDVAPPAYGALPAGAPGYLGVLRAWSGATLAAGSIGPVVAALQSALGVIADGSFGPATAAALTAWQAAHGLAPSGVVDPATWGVLVGLPPSALPAAPKTAPNVSPNVSPIAAPVAAASTRLPVVARSAAPRSTARPVLQLGSRGAWVRRVQAAVRLRPTGVFGPATRAAVQRFQRARHLPADGVVGPRTWAALAR